MASSKPALFAESPTLLTKNGQNFEIFEIKKKTLEQFFEVMAEICGLDNCGFHISEFCQEYFAVERSAGGVGPEEWWAF